MPKSKNLYTDDNPETTVKGLGFKDVQTAEKSIKKVEELLEKNEISLNHAKQISVAMEQRSKHHPHRNEDMEKAEKVWHRFLEDLKTRD